MKIDSTELPDLFVLGLDIHRDQRGFFAETWRDEWAARTGLDAPFVQDNLARSEQRGVLRGLHFQKPPHAQAKLVWVSRGAVYDAVVDLRAGSPTYGKSFGLILSEENALRLLVPKGFAHGYMTLAAGTEVQYKVNAYYRPDYDAGIRWDDPAAAVCWPDASAVLSEKDARLPLLADIRSPFTYAAR
jgi:dTDP-4-dehydrorhamnose 3,5-epimerase